MVEDCQSKRYIHSQSAHRKAAHDTETVSSAHGKNSGAKCSSVGDYVLTEE